jgi:DNA mismatch repair protein MutL
MPSEDYDVNVHPTKVEVRFDNANLVHSEVLAVLRDKLLSSNLDVGGTVPRGDFSDDEPLNLTKAFESDARKERIQKAMHDFFDKPTQARPQRTFSFTKPTHTHSKSISTSMPDMPLPDMPEFDGGAVSEKWLAKEFLQVHNSYILLQSEEGFVVIDQHALHERILYEQMCRRLREGTLTSQRLLMPHSFEVTAAQLEVYESQGALFEKLGIELEPFGPNTLAVQAFPALLEKADPVEFVREMLDKLIEEGGQADEERLLHEILDMAACKAAIKAGQPLSADEIAGLLKDKEIVQRTSRCPHGRPTTITFSLKELEKQFKRTGF